MQVQKIWYFLGYFFLSMPQNIKDKQRRNTYSAMTALLTDYIFLINDHLTYLAICLCFYTCSVVRFLSGPVMYGMRKGSRGLTVLKNP